ncbi:MAG: hypothetical protein GY946_26830 [bacterium]|nr:hypothetical protein [bacterium]
MKAITTMIGGAMALCVAFASVDSGALIQESNLIRRSGFDTTKLRESFERGRGISLDEKPNPDAAQREFVDSGSQGPEDLAHVFAREPGFLESQDDRNSLVR